MHRSEYLNTEDEILREPEEEILIRGKDDEETFVISEVEELALRNPKFHIEDAEVWAKKSEKEYSKKNEVPERIKPLLGLRLLNDYVESALQKKKPEMERPERFQKIAESEIWGEEGPYLPTIGTEIEIPHSLPIRGTRAELFRATERLGIPKAGTPNEEWEFAIPYTYSAEAQSAYAHELIRGGFIETEETEEGKQIRGGGNGMFSLHLNIGIPDTLWEVLDALIKEKGEKDAISFIKKDTAIFTYAFTTGFSSSSRIEKGKYGRPTYFGIWAEKSKKSEEHRSSENISEDSRRIELRSLEVRDKTLYRMFKEAQNLSSALFAEHAPQRDRNQEALSKIWERFQKNTIKLLESYSIANNLDEEQNQERIADAVGKTSIQKEMRALITATSLEIEKVLNEARKKR